MWSFGDFLGLQEIPEKCLTTSESTEVSENTWKRCFWIEKKSFFVYARNQTSSSSYHWSKGQHLTTWAIRPSHGIMIIIAYLKTNGLKKVTSAASSLYSHSQWLFYEFVSKITNKVVKQSLRVTVYLKRCFHEILLSRRARFCRKNSVRLLVC